MTPNDVVEYFGSAVRATKPLGYSEAAISRWKSKGYITIKTQYDIEIKTNGDLKAMTVEEYKPYMYRF